MIRLAAIAALCAAPVAAQNFPTHDGSRDEYTLDMIAPGLALVEYHNANPPSSHSYPRYLEIPGLRVELSLMTTSGPEVLRVYPPVGWVAEPDRVSVADGDTAYIEVRRVGEFTGM